MVFGKKLPKFEVGIFPPFMPLRSRRVVKLLWEAKKCLGNVLGHNDLIESF